MKIIFLKKMLKFAISSSRSENKKKTKKTLFAILTLRYCPKLLGEHVQKVSKKLTTRIVRLQRLKWIEKFFLLVPGRDNRL
jgi:hypothetical protein